MDVVRILKGNTFSFYTDKLNIILVEQTQDYLKLYLNDYIPFFLFQKRDLRKAQFTRA